MWDWPCSKLAEDDTIGDVMADWHIETKAHFFFDIALHHAAHDLVVKFAQQLLDALSAEVSRVSHDWFLEWLVDGTGDARAALAMSAI